MQRQASVELISGCTAFGIVGYSSRYPIDNEIVEQSEMPLNNRFPIRAIRGSVYDLNFEMPCQKVGILRQHLASISNNGFGKVLARPIGFGDGVAVFSAVIDLVAYRVFQQQSDSKTAGRIDTDTQRHDGVLKD